MPPAKRAKVVAAPAQSTLGGLVYDSDLEDELSGMSVTHPAPTTKAKTSATAAKKTKVREALPEPESPPPPTKKRGRSTATTATASANTPTTKPTANKIKKPTARPSRPLGVRARQALADELANTSTTSVQVPKQKKTIAAQPPIEEDEGDVTQTPEPEPAPPKAKATKARPTKKKTPAVVEPEAPAPPAKKLRRAPVRNVEPETEVEETMMNETMPTEEDEGVLETTQVTVVPPSPEPPTTKRVPASVLRAKKRPAPTDAESGSGEVALRRKLGEMNNKFESLESKYNALREIGIKEAERNYEKLKKQSEERVQTSTKLIAQLKEQVNAQTELALQGEGLRAELDQSEATVEQLRTKVAALEKALTDSRAENKNLVTKLAASRSNDISIGGHPSKGAGSGGLGGATRTMAASNEMVQAAQMKEDLYGDLTGLIIRGIKRDDTEEVFDCLQTGRSGTLHFKLAIEQEDGSNGEYEEAQFTYRPQLDENRDSELIELLPEYLTEEITFPRPHAAKFYTRVSRALME
ncbi:hypothetical protein BROUX41_004547 [Berkeleyomyces rouxiae]|uniref:uncharacterized protein n=1 Tax=Berkeleyomyces rouxiae TaxID=2035830 RepID=UPI003B768BA9